MSLTNKKFGFFLVLSVLALMQVECFVQQDKTHGRPALSFESRSLRSSTNQVILSGQQHSEEDSTCPKDQKWTSRIKRRFRVFSSVRSKLVATAVCALAYRMAGGVPPAEAKDAMAGIKQAPSYVAEKIKTAPAFIENLASTPTGLAATAGSTVVLATGAGTVLKLSARAAAAGTTTEEEQEAVEQQEAVVEPPKAEALKAEQQEVVVVKTSEPLDTRKFRNAREQPKPAGAEKKLANKYGAIEDVGERAFQILVDLGMVEMTPSV